MTKNLSKTTALSDSYKATLKQIKKRIYESRYKAFKAVNTQLIKLYWDLGKAIVEKQEKEKWGKSVVEQLSKDLELEFEGIRGFSFRNLWRMRQFYLIYRGSEKLTQLVSEIGWSHNIVIMNKCKDPLQQEFYIKMTIREGWSRSTLKDKIQTQEYERWALKQTNFDKTLTPSQARKAEVLVKDDYNFDFLLLEERKKERDLEAEIMKNIRGFLSEMDTYLSFIGNQVKLVLGENVFYIDLLFYHRILKCLVVIELKATKFKPEHAGKMIMYLSALEDKKTLEGENPPIGIIVCKSKNRTIVEYTLKGMNKPIGVATYRTYRDQKELPEKIAKYLPSREEISTKLVDIIESLNLSSERRNI